ncbi:hypothetical protein K469DRAFT_725112 [Zopfia rhizophila CBS 207.26]|uniref:Rhodopsin domain-containing protein n=1 Tax=Zopfia rhizophila CBS 207.26 TaxID=1314779 RepID=A0A6A6EBS5_9PEZI|nr:hypothetical protein K469DRAFT_725112 [Zopfia rhizophila CBS 207.26]
MATQAAKPVPSAFTTAVVVISAVFPAVSLLSALLRWYSRKDAKNGWRADDWWVVATWIISLGMSIAIWATVPDAGIDYLKAPARQNNISVTRAIWALTLIMMVALTTVKISILLFYKRVFPTPRFVVATWVGIGVVGAWGVAVIFLHTFQGDPVSFSWTGVGRKRMDPIKLSLARAGSSFALDVAVLLYPVPKIMKLHMMPERKLAVGLIFGLGGFCCIAAAVRLAIVRQTIAAAASAKPDALAARARVANTVIWCIIEPNCSIIAASLPCYGTLLKKHTPESLVRSVRSVLSLASGQGSNGSGRSNRSKGSRPYGAASGSGTGIQKPAKEITESEIELTDMSGSGSRSNEDHRKGWDKHPGGQTVAHVNALPEWHDGAVGNGNNIAVTKTYGTRADDQV